MTGDRQFPDDPAGPFPSPPVTISDADDRTIVIERTDARSAEDLPALIEMYDTFDPSDRAQGIPPVRRDDIIGWLDVVLGHGTDVIARDGDRIVGHATLVSDDANEAHELAIFVHQDYQGAGIGSKLLRCLLGAGADAGVELIWLTVERWNTVAIGLYEAVGFKACNRGRFEHEMSLRLA